MTARSEPWLDGGVVSSAANVTLLIVDDLAPLRSSLARLFKRDGFTVLEAGDGQEAIDLLRTASVQLIVTDLKMPRVDGVELIEHVRLTDARLPIILLSGFPGDAAERLRDLNRERLRLFEKPFVPETLRQAVSALLAE